MTEESRQNITESLREGMAAGYEATKDKPTLTWWERLLWILLSGLAAVASALLTSCSATYSQTPEGSVNAAFIIIPRGK